MAMRRYAARGGESGVVAYDTGPGWIRVGFADGAVYRYTDASAGAEAIVRMQALAKQGRGLSTFISQVVKRGYDRRSGP